MILSSPAQYSSALMSKCFAYRDSFHVITILSVSYHHNLLIVAINLTLKKLYLNLLSDVTDFMRLSLNIKTRKNIHDSSRFDD